MNSKLIGAVVAAASVPLAAMAWWPAQAAAPAAPASFAQCAVCHATDASASAKIGPHLAKVAGRKAGAVSGYNYSPALKNSGVTWTEAKLDAWLRSPTKMVPGAKMYISVSDPAKRAELIAYMKKL